MHARPFSPLMFIEQDPQMPSRQDLHGKEETRSPADGKGVVDVVLDVEQSVQEHVVASRWGGRAASTC